MSPGLEAALAAENEAIDLDLAWRVARSARFAELIAEDGISHPIVWKQLDGDAVLAELERRARRAQARARAFWLEASNGGTE